MVSKSRRMGLFSLVGPSGDPLVLAVVAVVVVLLVAVVVVLVVVVVVAVELIATW